MVDELLPHSTPEAQGVPSAAILDFVDGAEGLGCPVHNFVLVRHGHVVSQGSWRPCHVDDPRAMFSVSKSLTATAVGLAVAEGRLSVTDPVLPYFPDLAPATVNDHLAALRVEHLLTMTTGHDTRALNIMEDSSEDWARMILAHPLVHEPGTRYVYNNGATYLLSAIIQRLTGQTLFEYLRPRVLEPLGITDARWSASPAGVTIGAWGLHLRTTELARFGQLYLQRGMWQGQQLVPESWVEAATAAQVPSVGEAPEWQQGYGYQFWRCRYGAYRADGAFGQFSIVLPEQDAVVALTSGTQDAQTVLDLVWTHLLPAMTDMPLPDDPEAGDRLRQRLAGLRLPIVDGQALTLTAGRVSGRPYRMATETVTLFAGADSSRLVITDDRGTHEVTAGTADWIVGRSTLMRTRDGRVAAQGAWVDEATFELRVAAFQTPFIQTIRLQFDGETVGLVKDVNIRFDTGQPPTAHPMVGYAVDADEGIR